MTIWRARPRPAEEQAAGGPQTVWKAETPFFRYTARQTAIDLALLFRKTTASMRKALSARRSHRRVTRAASRGVVELRALS
jgi:hypothetical protein